MNILSLIACILITSFLDEAGSSEVVTTQDLQHQFTGLSDATAYNFEVSAVYTGGSLGITNLY